MSSMGAFISNKCDNGDGNSNDDKSIDFILRAQRAFYLRNLSAIWDKLKMISNVVFVLILRLSLTRLWAQYSIGLAHADSIVSVQSKDNGKKGNLKINYICVSSRRDREEERQQKLGKIKKMYKRKQREKWKVKRQQASNTRTNENMPDR